MMHLRTEGKFAFLPIKTKEQKKQIALSAMLNLGFKNFIDGKYN